MEKSKSKSKSKYLGIIIIVVAIVLLGWLLIKNTFLSNDSGKKERLTYEEKQYESFVKDLTTYVNSIDTSTDSDTDSDSVKMDFVSEVSTLQKKYENGTGVSYAANSLINVANSSENLSTTDFVGNVSSKLNELLKKIFNSTSPTKVLTLKSNTACNTKDIDSKYCVNNLSAKIYLASKESNKWVILIHGNMMNAKQMYNAVGDMYTSVGYNVLAPDLRGAGDSDGSVAMGYLARLDVYEGRKDLNPNSQERYGVNVSPETIVVHGVSLGGATTLQLATNPDISSATGREPYTKNLTSLHVKGFIDDCGYTSMSGIITDSISGGNSSQLSTVTSWLNTTPSALLQYIKNEATNLGNNSFDGFDFSNISSNKDLSKYIEKFGKSFDEIVKSDPNSNINSEINIPDISQDQINEWKNKISSSIGIGTSTTSNNKVTTSLLTNSSSLIDKLVMKAVINLVGVGLNENNYDKYSNVFSGDRHFPSGSKVVIIHGTSDTIVPYNNSLVIANHIMNTNDADLLYKWDVEGASHAFIVVGSHKTEYTNLVKNFAECNADSSKCSVFSSNDTNAPLNN